MKRGVGLVAAAAMVAAGVSAPARAADPDPTRILLVGDSVTHGGDGDYTWRYFAWKGLQQTGASVDFVGQHRDTAGGGGYADPDFDQDHAARWGMTMWDVLNDPREDTPAIGDLVRSQDPDVIVETLGVNDMTWLGLDAAAMEEQLGVFVAEARAAKPDVDIVLGAIPQEWFDHIAVFNDALPALAARLSTDESRVVAAPVPDFTEGVDTYDIAHPTTVGQVKIAAAVSGALESLGVGTAVTMPVPLVPGGHDPRPPEPEPEIPDLEPTAPPTTIEEVLTTPPAPAPAPPVAVSPSAASALDVPVLRAKALGDGRVRLRWTRDPDATATRVWIRGAGGWRQLRTDVAAPVSSYRLTLKPGRTYRFKVAAVGAVVSAKSTVARVRTR